MARKKKSECNIIGEKFDKLTVISLCDEKDNRGKTFYKCVCDCGKEIVRRRDAITRKGNKSCGCDFTGQKEGWRRKKEKQERRKQMLEADQLFDKTPDEIIDTIVDFKGCSLKEAEVLYKDWRKRFKKDSNAYIRK